MTGTKRALHAPEWFKPDAYAGADALDAGDWLLNLTVRCWLAYEPQPATEAALRKVGPVLRRGDAEQIRAMHLADCHRWVESFTHLFDPVDPGQRPILPSDVLHALRHGTVPCGIAPLSVAGLYVFERMLPARVREAGAAFVPCTHSPALEGTLDDAFEHQRTDRFVRVDLKLPDDVLHADLARYLRTERERLRKLGGKQPYREAARLKRKAHDPRTLAALGLLPFLDLDRWQRTEGLALSDNAICRLAGLDNGRARELRSRADDVLSQMRLHAWFARIERSMSARAPRRRPSRN